MAKFFSKMLGKAIPAGTTYMPAAEAPTRTMGEELAELENLPAAPARSITEELAELENGNQNNISINEQLAELQRQLNGEVEEEQNAEVAEAELEAAAAIGQANAVQNRLAQRWGAAANNETMEAELAALGANKRKGRKTRKARRAGRTLRKRRAANTLHKRMSHRRRR
jgi:hypothetical protein